MQPNISPQAFQRNPEAGSKLLGKAARAATGIGSAAVIVGVALGFPPVALFGGFAVTVGGFVGSSVPSSSPAFALSR